MYQETVQHMKDESDVKIVPPLFVECGDSVKQKTIKEAVLMMYTEIEKGASQQGAAKIVAERTGLNVRSLRHAHYIEKKKSKHKQSFWTCTKCGNKYDFNSGIDICECRFNPEIYEMLTSKTKSGAPTNAMILAIMSISQLERIADDDPRRMDALNAINKYIGIEISKMGENK